MFNRSRRNLAYWFAVSMGSILVVFAAAGYYVGVEEQLQAFDDGLYRQSKEVAGRTRYLLYQRRWQFASEDASDVAHALSLNSEVTYVRWYNYKKKLVLFVGAPAPRRLTVAPGFQTIPNNDNQNGETVSKEWLRQLTLAVVDDKQLVGYLQVATPLTPLRQSLNQRRLFLTLGVPVTLGVIGITGWFLGGLALQPAQQAYEQLQRFTADASHELRAPVAAILSNAQVALMPPEDIAEQRLRLGNIVEIAKSMSNLIGNLLFLSRHDGPLAPAQLRTIDLVQLLKSLVDQYGALATEQNLNFTSHLPAQPVTLKADPELLKQAVVNLLSNAFKYTPSGSTVQLRLFTQSQNAIIQVEDGGMGIPAENLPHIFERFYRVDTVRSRQTGGFGLGLAIAQQIVQAHRGRITAKSIVGQGSTFQIELPLKLSF